MMRNGTIYKPQKQFRHVEIGYCGGPNSKNDVMRQAKEWSCPSDEAPFVLICTVSALSKDNRINKFIYIYTNYHYRMTISAGEFLSDLNAVR